MKLFYNILFIFLFFSLSSCATMSVKVAVLDKKKFKELPGVVDAAVSEMEYEISRDLALNKYNILKGDLIINISNILSRLVTDGNLSTPDSSALFEAIKLHIEKNIEAADNCFRKGLSQVESARAAANDPERNRELLIDASISFASGKSILKEMMNKINKDFQIGGDLESANSDEKEKVLQKAGGLIGDAGLFGDPLVSFVSNLKKKDWKGTYNKTVTRNKFGNSDVAIKMESIGNFTIKGVRLDEANIVAASFKTLSQSIQFVSAVYGIPVPVQGGKDSDAEDELKNQFIDIEVQKKRLETHETLAKLSSVAIMDAIISRKDDLSDPSKLPDAIKSVKTTFEVYKPQLNSKITNNE